MKFVKEDLENMLREHKKNEAKILEIDIKLEEYSNRLEYAGTVYEETDKEIIESMQLSSAVGEVPSGKTNKISNVTEQTAKEYTEELKKYKDTIAAAEKRWSEVLDKLQNF